MIEKVELTDWAWTVLIGALGRDAREHDEAKKNWHDKHNSCEWIASQDRQLLRLFESMSLGRDYGMEIRVIRHKEEGGDHADA